MTGIEAWSTTAASNNAATPNGWPEGQAPSTVNDCARQMMASIRTWYQDVEWVPWGDTCTYVSGTSFKISGSDVTARYTVGRKVRAVGTSTGTIYGTIVASAFSTDTTVTITWDSGSLSNETLTVSLGAQNVKVPSSNLSIPTPQGRLTLVTATPVLVSDQTAKTTIYYTPYIGNLIPIYNGTYFLIMPFAELSIALDNASGHTGYQQSAKNFDLFVYNDAGTLRLGTGPAWSSATSRGTGAGTTQLTQTNGIWVNTVTIALRFGSSSGNTTSVSASQATYVGTMYATADGQTGVALKPAAAAGGSNNIIGLWNAYNRVKASAISRDSTTTWTYGTATFRAMDGSNSNRISLIDGLGQTPIKTHVQCSISSATAGLQIAIGTNLNSTSAQPAVLGLVQSPTATLANNYEMLAADESFYPSLGFNFYQAIEYVNGSTATFNPVSGTQALALDTEY